MLAYRFLIVTCDGAMDLKVDETQFIVLVGHGNWDGSLVTGEENNFNILLGRKGLEIFLNIAKASIVVVNIACHSDVWAPEHWTVVTDTVPPAIHSGCFAPRPIPVPRPRLQSMDDQPELESLVAYHPRWLPPSTSTETTATTMCC